MNFVASPGNSQDAEAWRALPGRDEVLPSGDSLRSADVVCSYRGRPLLLTVAGARIADDAVMEVQS